MNDIKAMFEIDFQSVLLALITFMAGFVAIKKIFTEMCGWLGLETRFMRDRREQKEDIEELKANDVEQDRKIDTIMDGMNRLEDSVKNLAEEVKACQKKNSEMERSKLGDRLTQSYRYYNEKKQMTSMEKWAFDNLVKAYLNSGGNSFVDEKIIPASQEWKVIDE